MNTNTIAAFYGGTGRNQIPLITLASTSETAVQINTDAATKVTALLAVPQGNAIVGSSSPLNPNANPAVLGHGLGRMYGTPNGEVRPYFNSSSFDGHPFKVRIAGHGAAVANAANTFAIKLYQGTSATLASDVAIASPTALATASTAKMSFILEATCMWNSDSQLLAGSFNVRYLYNGTSTVVAEAALAASTSVTSPAGLSFAASVTWGNAAGGTTQIDEFAIELL